MSRVFDLAIHFGPTLFWLFLTLHLKLDIWLAIFLDSLPTTAVIIYAESTRAIVKLPPYNWQDYWRCFKDTIVYGFVIGIAVVVAIHSLLNYLYPTQWEFGWLPAFILMDFSYYLIHRFAYHRSILWWLHKTHHEVSHLDFIRGNGASLLDQAVFSFHIPMGIWSWIFGASLREALIWYIAVLWLQVTHHLNISTNIGWLGYIFVDSHPHKLHHCIGGSRINLGLGFSIWDRLFGTYYEDRKLNPNELHERRINIKPLLIRS